MEGRLKFHDDRDILGVRVSVNDGNLLVRIRGLDRVWAFSRGLTIPLDRVEGAAVSRKRTPLLRPYVGQAPMFPVSSPPGPIGAEGSAVSGACIAPLGCW